jgi:hypothetical protein
LTTEINHTPYRERERERYRHAFKPYVPASLNATKLAMAASAPGGLSRAKEHSKLADELGAFAALTGGYGRNEESKCLNDVGCIDNSIFHSLNFVGCIDHST